MAFLPLVFLPSDIFTYGNLTYDIFLTIAFLPHTLYIPSWGHQGKGGHNSQAEAVKGVKFVNRIMQQFWQTMSLSVFNNQSSHSLDWWHHYLSAAHVEVFCDQSWERIGIYEFDLYFTNPWQGSSTKFAY